MDNIGTILLIILAIVLVGLLLLVLSYLTTWIRAMLSGARLDDANLRHAELARADLRGATLASADVTGAYTHLTRLEGADLSRVAGLTQGQLDLACGDEETLIPAGLERPSAWPCDDG